MECQKSDCFVVALILGNAKGAKETTNTRFMHGNTLLLVRQVRCQRKCVKYGEL